MEIFAQNNDIDIFIKPITVLSDTGIDLVYVLTGKLILKYGVWLRIA